LNLFKAANCTLESSYFEAKVKYFSKRKKEFIGKSKKIRIFGKKYISGNLPENYHWRMFIDIWRTFINTFKYSMT